MWKKFLKLFGYVDSDYKKIKMLGKGGFGKVYLVENKKNGNKYAMKIYHRNAQKNAQIQFNNLLKLGQKCDKYFVCPHQIIIDGFNCAVLIEYLDGYQPLYYFVSTNRLEINQKVEIANELIKGLKILHSLGLAHGDIKDDNIMIKLDNNKIKIKYIDFGKSCDENSCLENFNANLDQIKKGDLYALGLIISFLFTKNYSDWRGFPEFKKLKNDISLRNQIANKTFIQIPLDNQNINLLDNNPLKRHF